MEAVGHELVGGSLKLNSTARFFRAVVLSGTKYFEASFVTPDPEVSYFCVGAA
jgi:hypothetical protein